MVQLLWLLMTSLLIVLPQHGLGKYCTYSEVQYSSSAKYQTKYKAVRYSTRCWNLWKWWKCTKYRKKSQQESYQDVYSHTVTKQKCCLGWSGPSCGIHSESPTVVTCPGSFEVQAKGPSTGTVVSWHEPTFWEPYDYELKIRTTHDTPSTLPWGPTTVTYTATSTNNNKQATCSFEVFVKPPLDHAYISGYKNTRTAHMEEGTEEHLQCRADYGNPPFQLNWMLTDTTLQDQNYYTQKTSLAGYKNAVNDLYFTPDRTHNGTTLVCEATKSHRATERVVLTLNVATCFTDCNPKYYPDPVVEYCPDNRTLESSERVTEVAVDMPEFSDVNNDQLTMTCSALSLQDFLLGDNEIKCVAENQRTFRTSSCSYTLSLKPPACETPAAPGNGALLCGTYNDSVVNICQPMCLSGYDVKFDTVVPSLYICTLDGKWFPDLPEFSCQARTVNLKVDNMPSPAHYLRSGLACPEAAADEATVLAFSSTVRLSPYSSVCAHDNCEPLALHVFCED